MLPSEIVVGVDFTQIQPPLANHTAECMQQHTSTTTRIFFGAIRLLHLNVSIVSFGGLGSLDVCSPDSLIGCLAEGDIDVDIVPKLITHERHERLHFSYPFVYSGWSVGLRGAADDKPSMDMFVNMIRQQYMLDSRIYWLLGSAGALTFLALLFVKVSSSYLGHRPGRLMYKLTLKSCRALLAFVALEKYVGHMEVATNRMAGVSSVNDLHSLINAINDHKMQLAVVGQFEPRIVDFLNKSKSPRIAELYKSIYVDNPEQILRYTNFTQLCEDMALGRENIFLIELHDNILSACNQYSCQLKTLHIPDSQEIMASFAFPRSRRGRSFARAFSKLRNAFAVEAKSYDKRFYRGCGAGEFKPPNDNPEMKDDLLKLYLVGMIAALLVHGGTMWRFRRLRVNKLEITVNSRRV